MRFLLTSLCILFTCGIIGQNLVPNPGFEEFRKCPRKVSQLNRAKDWDSPTKGTPDYFCSCANQSGKDSDVGIPRNAMGNMPAHGGSAYVGIIAYSNNDNVSEREYLQVKLSHPLQADSVYCISFYAALAQHCDYAIDALGAYLSPTPLLDKRWVLLAANPQVENATKNILMGRQWNCIKGTYTARGGEQYLIIGDFLKPQDLYMVRQNMHNYFNGYAYYYIDDVSVMPASQSKVCGISYDTVINLSQLDTAQPATKTDSIVPDSSIVLKNIFFETDKAVLLTPSFKELDKLVAYLASHPAYSIFLSGYTDNTGIEPHNHQLSEARAESVAYYLQTKGIAQNRISYAGFGSSHPIAGNDTPEGRQKNRRVEFRLTKTK